MVLENIRIIGTSHISKESILEVKNTIIDYDPDIIALELDPIRYNSLISNKKNSNLLTIIKQIGVRGLILNYIGAYIEKKLGQKVKVKPGAEMKMAIKLAKENKKEIALIDQDIRITIKKLTKEVTVKEKFKIFLDIIKSPFSKKELITIDLSKVPEQEFIDKIINEVKKRYPCIYKILIEDRNRIIAKNLNNLKIKKRDKKILVIIGAGHKKEVEKLISNDII